MEHKIKKEEKKENRNKTNQTPNKQIIIIKEMQCKWENMAILNNFPIGKNKKGSQIDSMGCSRQGSRWSPTTKT